MKKAGSDQTSGQSARGMPSGDSRRLGADGTADLRPHRPESHLRHCLDVTYDPQATCPKYDQALREIFAKADNPAAMVRHFNEVFGYIIQPKRNLPAIVIMSGGGDNGKTVLIRTVTWLLGTDLVHAQRVEDLEPFRHRQPVRQISVR
jgi:putative DNA primase/helicase